MMISIRRSANEYRSFVVCAAIYACLASAGSSLRANSTASVDFVAEVQPILQKCAACHGGVKQTAGLSVLSRQRLLAPTDSGEPVIVAGDPDRSELMRRVTSADPDQRMPPEDPLDATQVATLRRWIETGVPWPEHWAYAPISSSAQAPPAEPGTDPHPIDRHVRGRLARLGIQPSPPADRPTLIRRLSLDLTGLLPTPSEVDAFVADRRTDAYERLVDRLLSSPHFGERWARHWLDEARYADSEGYEKDTPKNDAFRFRDWVIEAINDDMPFDKFTERQIAGDLMPGAMAANLIATKFHLQAQFNLEGGVDAEEDRTKRVIDRVNTVGTVWMATTIGCCQCHDHPYDPLSQRDFYGLYAFFNNMNLEADFLADPPDDADAIRQERSQKWAEISEMIRQQVTNKNLSSEVQGQLSKLRDYDNSKGLTRFLKERSVDRRATYLFHRGDFLQPLADQGEVPPGTPQLLPPLCARGKEADRLDLARWLTDPQHPLTSRVVVNKVWMHLFGAPLAQPDDFGSRGSRPELNELILLDDLAHWFVHEAAWRRKGLIRCIVTSETYRQSSATRPELDDIDPDNRLLARQGRFRVEAEVLRDMALQAAGLLSRKIGGPSVFPPLPAIVAEQTYAGSFKFEPSQGEDRYRRGLYTFFRRTAIDPNLLTFDCPDASMSRPARDRSNNPLQSLALLQNEVFHEAAQAFAARLLGFTFAGGLEDDHRLRHVFVIAVSRPPDAAELIVMTDLLTSARAYYRDAEEEAGQLVGPHRVADVAVAENAAWIATARAVLNLDEFLTRE